MSPVRSGTPCSSTGYATPSTSRPWCIIVDVTTPGGELKGTRPIRVYAADLAALKREQTRVFEQQGRSVNLPQLLHDLISKHLPAADHSRDTRKAGGKIG